MIAFSLDTQIKEAYKYLMAHYSNNDRIYLFGFSRGAYTARVLAAMIERVGLLTSGNDHLVDTAYKCYISWEYGGQKSNDDPTSTLINEFKNTFSKKIIYINIYFMGLWDSVNSVGIFRDRLFPYTTRSNIVKHVRHAISIDEHRARFKQMPFASPGDNGNNADNDDNTDLPDYITLDNFNNNSVSKLNHDQRLQKRINKSTLTKKLEKIYAYLLDKKTNDKYKRLRFSTSSDLVEKWFPGTHSDVGGGWYPDENGQYLSNISLRWMLSEAIIFGVMFKKNSIHEFARQFPSLGSLISCEHDLLGYIKYKPLKFLRLNNLSLKNMKKKTLAQAYNINHDYNYDIMKDLIQGDDLSMLPDVYGSIFKTLLVDGTNITFQGKKSQTINSFYNILTKKHECLRGVSKFNVLFWNFFEIIPVGIKFQNEQSIWTNYYSPNLRRGRNIPPDAVFHWSFYWRLKLVEDYDPKNVPKEIKDRIKDDLDCQVAEVEQFKKDNWKNLPDDLEYLLAQYPTL
ncbi:uncharacterized protein ASCRUDRAFT_76444 [Ascoidea rubescens DSM 1968]|uniref:T6SS Phospholipase effector Tle1-like catalytic domain-containing protein n=1 Tax=Ascoidea rubescens DSM 1968 TaxID=1344418 RepID=A0A1D2VFR0_9ASCO|nr:hypothetical protein ASCRUDRAFT_76444 [Ascoidea rubescens DSM 1968]ODV60466.1 hypothetical protein ASCRUDRAFT_76444 [Ascoidea rubescens DSM 1968]